MITIDELDLPVVKDSPFGQVVLTHRAWGFTIQAWNTPPMKSYSVLGVLVGDTFQVYPGTEEYASFAMTDFLALSSDPVVGPHVVATIEAVKAAHQRIVGATSQPLTTPHAAASSLRPETSHGSTDTKSRARRAARPVRRRTR